MEKHRVILIVRDGWGYTMEKKGNAIYFADTPNNDYYLENYPWTLLKCTGSAVGVPEGTQGSSESGHLTMGAGRIVLQPLEEINRSIRDSSFYKNEALLKEFSRIKGEKGKLHLMGLLSDQGIHGTTHHLYALLKYAQKESVQKVYIHCFLDGRDVPERSAKRFLLETMKQIGEKKVGYIASIIGRYYAMDRDNNWDRTEKTYNLLTLGEGHKEQDVLEAVENAYSRGDMTDYYVKPIVMVNTKGKPLATIDDDDSVIFWNFRSDRTRQITYALTQNTFQKFERRKYPSISFVGITVYDQNIVLPAAFPQKKVNNNLGEVLSRHGFKQLRIAETEKYAHVTFFFNSQIEDPYHGEERILVPSPKVPNYQDKPEMSASEITERLLPEIRRCKYDFFLVNYANGDLVGHSANLQAGIMACEVVDRCVGKIVDAGLEKGYVILITGDHGNIETMFYPDGEPNPSHGVNSVPFILISEDKNLRNRWLRKGLGLSSVAPTILKIMDIVKPIEMTGESVLC
jgi:2,3-bisphosphoglycerate-independent phosphoglycerate mutase